MKPIPKVVRQDPCEFAIRNALVISGLDFLENVSVGIRRLDFYIPSLDLYIEVKQFHTARVAEQMKVVQNIIAIQGLRACLEFAKILENMRPDK